MDIKEASIRPEIGQTWFALTDESKAVATIYITDVTDKTVEYRIGHGLNRRILLCDIKLVEQVTGQVEN